MKEEPPFDLISLIKTLNQKKVRYLLIGRWAVAYYGSPVVTADYDFWIDPGDRKTFLNILEKFYEAELPSPEQQKKPMVSVYVGPDQIDCFSPRRISNREGEELVFDKVYSRSKLLSDPSGDFSVRVPSVDDMIALKKFDPPDPLMRQRNLEDIRFLMSLKKKKRS